MLEVWSGVSARMRVAVDAPINEEGPLLDSKVSLAEPHQQSVQTLFSASQLLPHLA